MINFVLQLALSKRGGEKGNDKREVGYVMLRNLLTTKEKQSTFHLSLRDENSFTSRTED
jgi:hypothetical protein